MTAICKDKNVIETEHESKKKFNPEIQVNRPLRVLMVENYKYSRSTLMKRLSEAGYIVVAKATNVRDALKKQSQYNPDIVLVDYDFYYSTENVIRELKRGCKKVTILLIWGWTEEGDEVIRVIKGCVSNATTTNELIQRINKAYYATQEEIKIEEERRIANNEKSAEIVKNEVDEEETSSVKPIINPLNHEVKPIDIDGWDFDDIDDIL